MNIEKEIELAKEGNLKALESIVKSIQDNVLGLSLKMLYSPEDAEDATQEILIKVITNLSSFRGDSRFSTWVYRIAANYLLRVRQTVNEQNASSFDECKEGLELDASSNWKDYDHPLLIEQNLDEIRISCLQGLLLCLNRELRIVFLLVDIFKLNSNEGAEILGISPAAFRKRLSRAREKIQSFMSDNCSLVNKNAGCKCAYHVATNGKPDRFEKNNLTFMGLRYLQNIKYDSESIVREMDELEHIGLIYRNDLKTEAGDMFFNKIKDLIKSDKYKFFNN